MSRNLAPAEIAVEKATEIWDTMNAPDSSEFKLMVLRLEPRKFCGLQINGYLETFHLPTTIPDIIQEVGAKYGGGKFQIRIVDGAGKYVKSKTFEIAGDPTWPGKKPDIESVCLARKEEEIQRLNTQLAHKNSLLEIKDQLILNKDRELMKNNPYLTKEEIDEEFLSNSHDDIDLSPSVCLRSHEHLPFDSRGQQPSTREAIEDWSDFAMKLHATETVAKKDVEIARSKKDVEVARSEQLVSMYRYELYATVIRWIAAAATFSSMTYFIA